ncbi:hypothetical protein ACS0TY_023852 [Phlomoides rotata]
MARKRVRKEQVTNNERKRNNVLMKRIESLTKQANDMSILCGIEMGIVIHKPGEDNAVLWPSPRTFGERMQKFLDFPEMERWRKMVIHGEQVEEKLNVAREERVKCHHKNKLMVSYLLMNELLSQRKTFHEVDLVQLNDLQFLTVEILKKLEIRDDELNNDKNL